VAAHADRTLMTLIQRALLLAFVAVALLSPGLAAADAVCPQQIWSGQAPALTNPKLTPKTRTLCYSGFAVLHSGLTRTPLWVAEHLTRDRVQAARALTRVNAFHPDPNLPASERAELSDYARSGFDRGHMAPAGDMGTPESMEQSFSLANMVPQNSDNNRNLWESIERAVRDLTEREGELFVVTGPIFEGENLQALNGRVLVPTHVFKAVYLPRQNAAAAYLAPNMEGNEYQIVSLSGLQQRSGIDAFPGLSQAIKDTAAALPQPRLRRPRDQAGAANRPAPPARGSTPQPSGANDGFIEGILNAIDQIGRRP